MCNSLSTVTVVQPESVTLASDHLPARPTGQWVQGKNYYLCRYLDIMTHGVVKKWEAKLAYVDLFAGPGRSIIRDTGEEVEGSPVVSLKYEFAKYIFEGWYEHQEKNERGVVPAEATISGFYRFESYLYRTHSEFRAPFFPETEIDEFVNPLRATGDCEYIYSGRSFWIAFRHRDDALRFGAKFAQPIKTAVSE